MATTVAWIAWRVGCRGREGTHHCLPWKQCDEEHSIIVKATLQCICQLRSDVAVVVVPTNTLLLLLPFCMHFTSGCSKHQNFNMNARHLPQDQNWGMEHHQCSGPVSPMSFVTSQWVRFDMATSPIFFQFLLKNIFGCGTKHWQHIAIRDQPS